MQNVELNACTRPVFHSPFSILNSPLFPPVAVRGRSCSLVLSLMPMSISMRRQTTQRIVVGRHRIYTRIVGRRMEWVPMDHRTRRERTGHPVAAGRTIPSRSHAELSRMSGGMCPCAQIQDCTRIRSPCWSSNGRRERTDGSPMPKNGRAAYRIGRPLLTKCLEDASQRGISSDPPAPPATPGGGIGLRTGGGVGCRISVGSSCIPGRSSLSWTYLPPV